MKRFLLLLCLISSNSLFAQNWQWAKRAGGSSTDYIYAICSDFNGNVYITGTYSFIFMNAPAASISFDNITLPPYGDNQIYIAKYSPTGTILWAKSIGGNNIIGNSDIYESSRSISYDPFNQCLYLTGNIYGFASFGSTTLSGYGVSFYTKMDLNGNFIWAKSLPYSYSSYISISCDLQGHQLIYGYTSDTLLVGIHTVSPGGFIAKFNNIGSIIWSKHITSGSPFVKVKLFEGKIYGIINLDNDSLTLDTALFVSNSPKNALLTCLDSSGKLSWYKEVKSNSYISFLDFDLDLNGNIFLTGNFNTNADFGFTQLTNSNLADILIVKYDSTGNISWIRQGNCTYGVSGDFARIFNGNLYVSGALIGGLMLDTVGIVSTINSERFISNWTTSGNIISVAMTNIANHSIINLSYDNKFYIGGDFYQNLTIGSNSLTSVGYNDVFIAKYDLSTDIKEPGISKSLNQLYIHANPNEGKCNITVPDEFLHEKNLVLSIYNSSGKLIQQKNLEMNEGKIKLSLEAEAKGLYNAVLSNGTKSYSGKIVFE